MIGRDGSVRPFELLRWAREAAREHDLRPTEAHVLLLLATYADKDAVAWPSIATLARDAGLKVTRKVRRDRKTGAQTTTYESTAVSEALARLQERRLIWRKQAGRGRPATTELLFKPTGSTVGKEDTKPTGDTVGKKSRVAHRPGGGKPTAQAVAEVPAERLERQRQRQRQNGQMTPTADAVGRPPTRSDRALRRGAGFQPIGAVLAGSLPHREREGWANDARVRGGA